MLALLLLQTSSSASSDAATSALCGGFGLLYLACYGIIIIAAIALFVFWLIMLIDCIQRQEAEFPNSSGNSKTMWLVALLVAWIFGLNWLAAILYYFMVKRKAPRGKATSSAPPPPPAPPVTPEQ